MLAGQLHGVGVGSAHVDRILRENRSGSPPRQPGGNSAPPLCGASSPARPAAFCFPTRTALSRFGAEPRILQKTRILQKRRRREEVSRRWRTHRSDGGRWRCFATPWGSTMSSARPTKGMVRPEFVCSSTRPLARSHADARLDAGVRSRAPRGGKVDSGTASTRAASATVYSGTSKRTASLATHHLPHHHDRGVLAVGGMGGGVGPWYRRRTCCSASTSRGVRQGRPHVSVADRMLGAARVPAALPI